MKNDFPILTNTEVIYLDNAATTQKPKQVIKSIIDYYEKYNANVHRGIHRLSQESTFAYSKAREKVAKFINAWEEEIIFTKGTTESLNILAQALKLEEGDEIVLTEMEHHSNIVPWQQVAKEKGAKVRYIPITEDYRLDLEAAKEIINKKTKIVSIVHMSNVLGTINPVKELCNLAHKVGALFIIDAAQSVPHMQVDVRELDCDFLAFSGHKMLGPTGVGVLYGKKKFLKSLEPVAFGGGMINTVTKDGSTWADVPERFEAGTPNIAQAIGLGKAVGYLEEFGIEKIESHDKELTEYGLKELSKVEGLEIIGPKDLKNRGAVLSFTLEGAHPHDICEILDKENIAVRGGHHCTMPLHKKLNLHGTVRASFYIYNSKEDVDALVKSLEKVKEVFK